MNKKYFYTLVASLMLTVSFGHFSGFIKVFIKTNYFDLPQTKVMELQNQLGCHSLQSLTQSCVSDLGQYLSEKLLGDNNLTSNYFWNIYNALPDFVDARERHSGYNKGARKYSYKEQLMAYAIYRIDRRPENIQAIFNIFKPLLPQIVTKETYYQTGMAQHVAQVLECYKLVTAQPNYSQLLQNAYNQADTTTGSFTWEGNSKRFQKFEHSAYGFTVYELNNIIAENLKLDAESSLRYNMWLSFWMRRNHEGNMSVVYDILKQIQQIYNSEESEDAAYIPYGEEVAFLNHVGKIVYFQKWVDNFGENVLLLTEQTTNYDYDSDFPTKSIELYAYHYANSGDGFLLISKHTDEQLLCGFENRARFMENWVSIADNNQNGLSEITFMYRLGCSSELSPDKLHLVTMENGKKFKIEGNTKIQIHSSFPVMGGEMHVGREFLNASESVQAHAKQLFTQQQNLHIDFNSVRIYQLHALKALGNISFFGVEPFWHIDIHENKLAYTPMGEETKWFTYQEISEQNELIEITAFATATNETIVLKIEHAPCNDGMSDNTYEFKAKMSLNNREYEACGRKSNP